MSETTLESAYIIDVINSFSNLKDALNIVFDAIVNIDKELPAWFEEPKELSFPSNYTTRLKIAKFLQQLEYLDTQNPREILVGAGILAASPDTMKNLNNLNKAKDTFKAAMLAFKKLKISMQNPQLIEHFEKILDQRKAPTTTALKKLGALRLHLKQCYRKIPLFEQKPVKASWTWANTRAITRINTFQAITLLNKQGQDYGIQSQLQKLASISEDEPLAIVQELAPHLRVNIVLKDKNQESYRVMVKGPIPLFYLDDLSGILPSIKPPGKKKGRQEDKPARRDAKLNPEPFLPAIRVHRYNKN